MAKPLIMVVEDDVSFANKTAEIIRASGKYEAVAAYSASEAFDLLKKHRTLFGLGDNRIRLILLDIKMPEMDGLQFLEKMRKKYGADDIGVIMVTAYEDEEKWERATNEFIVGYITKPFESQKLLSEIDLFFSDEKAPAHMTLDTFEKHIEKREEFKKQKEKN